MFSHEFQTIQNHLQHAIYFETKKPSMSLGFEFPLVWEGMTLPFIARAQKSHTHSEQGLISTVWQSLIGEAYLDKDISSLKFVDKILWEEFDVELCKHK